LWCTKSLRGMAEFGHTGALGRIVAGVCVLGADSGAIGPLIPE
jgi:hypothetical protein